MSDSKVNRKISTTSTNSTKIEVSENEIFRLEPPNGGFGWWVCFGSTLVHMFNLSFSTVFGLLFGEFLEDLGQNTSGIVFVVNLCSVTVNLSGLLTGIVLKQFTPRQVTMAGSILTGLGLLVCAFAKVYWVILVGYSLMVGIGLGLVNPASFLAVDAFFTTKKTRAMGISFAGASIGHILLPNIISYLLQHYGYRVAIGVKAALCIFGVVGGAFFMPVDKHMKKIKVGIDEIMDETGVAENEPEKQEKVDLDSLKKPVKVIFYIDENELAQQNWHNLEKDKRIQDIVHHNEEIEKQENEQSIWEHLCYLMDLKLLKCPVFLNIVFGIGICTAVTINFSLLLPFFLQEYVKLDTQRTAICLSMVAATDLISRLSFPFITEKFDLCNRLTFLFGAICMGLARTILAETTAYNVLLVICGLFGYFKALAVVNQGLSLSEYCSTNCPGSLPGALGLLMLFKGFCTITLGQVLGWIRDYSSSYAVVLHAQDLFIFFIVVFWTIEMLYKKSRPSQKGLKDEISVQIHL